MEDDLILGLTRQVKEEVVENYLTERRILTLQIEGVHRLAEEARAWSVRTGRRLKRLAYLMILPEMEARLLTLLEIPSESFWVACLRHPFSNHIRFIRVRAITERGKYKKLVLEAYFRLHEWMENYRKVHADLEAECRAVNLNITHFQRNFDLLAILTFLRSLDTQALEHKHYLGENFTAEELSSVDQKLFIRSISFDGLGIPKPLLLTKPEAMEGPLSELANEIYRRCQDRVKYLIR